MALILGDCLEELKNIENDSIDMIYLDPPFFTQRKHKLTNKENSKTYSFEDNWDSIEEYQNFIEQRLIESHRVLKNTGSVFLHCDRTASHYLRIVLDKVFGTENFRSEIIWTYKRWSNSKKGLLNNHQNIYFYSKTKDFKFNKIYTDYSPTTNIDQILQGRERDKNNKTVYKRDENGEPILNLEKKGVPLSDVWEIPYLNPKARERTGYPTQKPILLLDRIIEISTDEGDTVLDPFCGSGTTLVSAKLLNRKYLGIDISKEAIELAQSRLDNPIKTKSNLLKKGIEGYINKTEEELLLIEILNAIPVQRNRGIDGILKEQYNDTPILIKIQKKEETFSDALNLLLKASEKRQGIVKVLVKTQEEYSFLNISKENLKDLNVILLEDYNLSIKKYLNELNSKNLKMDTL